MLNVYFPEMFSRLLQLVSGFSRVAHGLMADFVVTLFSGYLEPRFIAETFGNKRCVFFVACNFSGKLRGMK